MESKAAAISWLNPASWLTPGAIYPAIAVLVGSFWMVTALFSGVACLFRRMIAFFNPFRVAQFVKSEKSGEYEVVEMYLSKFCVPMSCLKAWEQPNTVFAYDNDWNLAVTLKDGETVRDVVKGKTFYWMAVKSDKTQYYELTYSKFYAEFVYQFYLPGLVFRGSSSRQVFSNEKSDAKQLWTGKKLNHNARLSTFAMDAERKCHLKAYVCRFLGKEQDFKAIGQAWTTSLYLHGSSGNGKTTLVACVAELTIFDVYKFDLDEIIDDKDLHKLMRDVKSRSILVFEDFDKYFLRKGQINNERKNLDLPKLVNCLNSYWCQNDGPRMLIFTSQEDYSPEMARHVDGIIELPNCDYEQFHFLAVLYRRLPATFEQWEQIELLMPNVEISISEVCRIMKEHYGDLTNDDDFVQRMSTALGARLRL